MITVYFWWRNTKGLHESSDDALRIMKITTVMVVILIVWCGLTLLAARRLVAAGAAPAQSQLLRRIARMVEGHRLADD